jgi:hypothetical protein
MARMEGLLPSGKIQQKRLQKAVYLSGRFGANGLHVSSDQQSVMMRYLLVPLALMWLAGCSEPFIVFAGGELSGTVATPPEDWSALQKEETFQLETRPEDPYSVNVWAVGIGPDVYVGTGPDGTNWSGYIQEDPRVRLRVSDTLYPLLAQPVTEREERRRVARGYADKYGLDSDENWVKDALVFRLDRR